MLLIFSTELSLAQGIYDFPFTEEKYSQWSESTKAQMVKNFSESIYEGCINAAKKAERNKEPARFTQSKKYCGCLGKVASEQIDGRKIFDAFSTVGDHLTETSRILVSKKLNVQIDEGQVRSCVNALHLFPNGVSSNDEEGLRGLEQTANRTKTIAENALTQTNNAPEVPLPLHLDLIPVVNSNSNFIGTINQIYTSRTNRELNRINEYNQNLASTKLSSLLEPERILKDVPLTESRAIIKKAKKLAASQIPLYEKNIVKFKSDVQNADLTDSQKEFTLNSFEKSQKITKPATLEELSLEVLTMDEYESAFELLTDKSKWTYKIIN